MLTCKVTYSGRWSDWLRIQSLIVPVQSLCLSCNPYRQLYRSLPRAAILLRLLRNCLYLTKPRYDEGHGIHRILRFCTRPKYQHFLVWAASNETKSCQLWLWCGSDRWWWFVMLIVTDGGWLWWSIRLANDGGGCDDQIVGTLYCLTIYTLSFLVIQYNRFKIIK